MLESYSSRLLERVSYPKFSSSKDDLDNFMYRFSDSDFAYVFQVANSNGVINFYGNIDQDFPRKFKSLRYETNITGPALGYLDALCELLLKREWPNINKTLTTREVDYFLRDVTDSPSIPEGVSLQFRIHDALNGFESYLQERFLLSNRRKSPTFNENAERIPYYASQKQESFFNVKNSTEQYQIVDEILDMEVREQLKRDGGDVDLCYVGPGIVSISYSGNCTDCSSSLGTTLKFIQDTLRFNLSEPNLLVVTDS